MRVFDGILIGLAALAAGFVAGRAVQRKLDEIVYMELIQEDAASADGYTRVGFLKIDGANIDIVQNIGDATAATREVALKIRSTLPFLPGQTISILSLEDAALLTALQTA